MVNKLLWEAQPPMAMSTTRGTVVRRPFFGSLLWPRGAHKEPYLLDDLGSQGALSPG